MRRGSLSLEHFRDRLAHAEALPQLVALGLVTGILSAGVILLFRLLITWPLELALPVADSEQFETLSTVLRFSLPIAGSLLIALLLYQLKPQHRSVGIAHVLERLDSHQGQLPLPNALVQFFIGAIPLLSGHSAGREGPAVHLGAATASLLGQFWQLPLNSVRTLVGCGTAAAISASFNTPIAGVIFAMEVVMMEYSVAGFTPVIVAAFTATLVTQLFYGDQTAFTVPAMQFQSLSEFPFVLLLGLVIGLLAILFSRILLLTQSKAPQSLFWRLLLAGVITGTLAIPAPQIMGIGYDTLSQALQGSLPLLLLVGLVVAKLIATAMSVGLGVPMGLIGPSLFIGAAAGGALGLVTAQISGTPVTDSGFYAMIGMVAMMGALLQAPLAALMAILELTDNPHILFPAMLAVVVASLVYRQLGKLQPIFLAILHSRGLELRRTPLTQVLERASVTSLMDRNFSRYASAELPLGSARLLAEESRWILVESTGEAGKPIDLTAVSANDLLRVLEEHPDSDRVNLLEIPAQRLSLQSIDARATLRQALEQMDSANLDALSVLDRRKQVRGLLFRKDIQHFYAQAPE